MNGYETEWVIGEKLIRDGDKFVVLAHGNSETMIHRVLQPRSLEDIVQAIKDAGWNGQEILLVSCNTGGEAFISVNHENIMVPNIASQISSELNAVVIAPDNFVWVDKNGNMLGVYGSTPNEKPDYSNPGKWNTYKNGKLQ
jgi:hypothetical protein